MNKQKLREHYYSVLNEGIIDWVKKRLGGLGGMAAGALAGYGVSEFFDYITSKDKELSGDFKGGRDYGFNQPYTSSSGSGGRRGTLEPTSWYSGGMKRGLDKKEAMNLAAASGKGEEARRAAQIGTTGRTRAAARNIMKGRIADLKAKAATGVGSSNGKTTTDLSLLSPEERQEYMNLTGQYKQMDSGKFNLQTQPRSNPVATQIGRLNQRGVRMGPPRSADEAQLRQDALADIEAEDAELRAQGRSFTGYDDRGEMYRGFGRRGFALGKGYDTTEEIENRASEKTLKSQGYDINPRGKSQKEIAAEMKKQLEDKMKSDEEKLRKFNEEERKRIHPLMTAFGTEQQFMDEEEAALRRAEKRAFR